MARKRRQNHAALLMKCCQSAVEKTSAKLLPKFCWLLCSKRRQNAKQTALNCNWTVAKLPPNFRQIAGEILRITSQKRQNAAQTTLNCNWTPAKHSPKFRPTNDEMLPICRQIVAQFPPNCGRSSAVYSRKGLQNSAKQPPKFRQRSNLQKIGGILAAVWSQFIGREAGVGRVFGSSSAIFRESRKIPKPPNFRQNDAKKVGGRSAVLWQ